MSVRCEHHKSLGTHMVLLYGYYCTHSMRCGSCVLLKPWDMNLEAMTNSATVQYVHTFTSQRPFSTVVLTPTHVPGASPLTEAFKQLTHRTPSCLAELHCQQLSTHTHGSSCCCSSLTIGFSLFGSGCDENEAAALLGCK